MRFRLVTAFLTAAVAAAILAPSASAAGCKTVGFATKGKTVRNADYLEWPPGKKGKLTVKEAVEGKTLESFTMYYVPSGGRLRFESAGTTYSVAPRTIFVPQCDGGVWWPRLMSGRVDVSGARFSGNRPKSTMNSPEAVYMPLPGKPRYSVTRKVGSTKAKSYAVLSTKRGSSQVFARMQGGMLFAGKSIPGQIGRSLVIYATGKYKNR